VLQGACRAARAAAGFDKPVTMHTLRHNSESRIIPSVGPDDAEIQTFLGRSPACGSA
jgi:hypothetical protein